MAKEKAVIRTDMSRFRWTLLEMKKNKVAYLMIAPFFILFALFTIVPVVLSFLLSFTNFNLLEWPDFVLLDNYIRLFLDDDVFITAIKNTLMFATVTGPGSYLLSMLLAWFINELRPRIRSIVTLLFYAPSISGNVYLIWQYLFSGDAYGLVNATLSEMGLIDAPILWFQDAKYVMGLCLVVSLWTSLGTAFVRL
jgi:multiple sugar transport system permease protein